MVIGLASDRYSDAAAVIEMFKDLDARFECLSINDALRKYLMKNRLIKSEFTENALDYAMVHNPYVLSEKGPCVIIRGVAFENEAKWIRNRNGLVIHLNHSSVPEDRLSMGYGDIRINGKNLECRSDLFKSIEYIYKTNVPGGIK